MTTTAWFEAVSERINPIVVKELRQGLRTRVFWVCFTVLLLACFLIALGAWAGSLDGRIGESGQPFFFGFFICLGAVQFFIIPYTAYRSLAREREEETWVLLSLTGLGARRVLRGKIGSYLAQAGLYASAVLPFLLFSYYLNGIDLPTILLVSALGFAWMIFLTCAAVCAATLGESRIIRGLVHFAVLGTLLGAVATAWTVAGAIVFDGNSLWRDGPWVAAGVILWLMLSFGVLLFEAAASQLALATEDTARGPRLALVFQVVGSAAILAWAWIESGREREVAIASQLLLAAHLLFVGTFLVSAERKVHPSHAGRRFWPLLRPGPLSAFWLIVVLLGVVTAGALTLYIGSANVGSRSARELMMLVAAAAFALLFLALPVVVTHLVPIRTLSTPLGQRAVAFVVLTSACAVPPFTALVLGFEPEDRWINLFNPILGLLGYVGLPKQPDVPPEMKALVIVGSVAGVLSVWAERILSKAERSSRA
ncbi:MAG: ABC transporter permease [Myxococcaceae bacterium]